MATPAPPTEAIINYLKQFVTANRWQTMQAVLHQRTRQVTVVLEDIYQPHNASAVLRSCDAFGVQDVHLIENKNRFELAKGVALGTERWLTLYHYQDKTLDNTTACLAHLKQQGYTLVATTPRPQGISITEVPITCKIALLFGTELSGLSERALGQADLFATIPMLGFCESLNISVSVAVCLYEITTRLRRSAHPWQLSQAEKADLQLTWLRQSIKGADHLEKQFRANYQ